MEGLLNIAFLLNYGDLWYQMMQLRLLAYFLNQQIAHYQNLSLILHVFVTSLPEPSRFITSLLEQKCNYIQIYLYFTMASI